MLANIMERLTDPVNWVLATFVGLVTSTWFQFFVRRPKLKQIGGGSGISFHVTFQNKPGFFGINFGPTTIFGKDVLGPVTKGTPFDRTPVRDCHVVIYDKDTQESASLYWRKRDDLQNYHRELTIGPGEIVDLFLFVRPDRSDGKYYFWRPSKDGGQFTPQPGDIKIEDGRDFFVDVYYSNVRRMRFFVRTKKLLAGGYYVEGDLGGGSF